MPHEAAPLYAPHKIEMGGGGSPSQRFDTVKKRPEPEKIVKHHRNYGKDGAITKKYMKYEM